VAHEEGQRGVSNDEKEIVSRTSQAPPPVSWAPVSNLLAHLRGQGSSSPALVSQPLQQHLLFLDQAGLPPRNAGLAELDIALALPVLVVALEAGREWQGDSANRRCDGRHNERLQLGALLHEFLQAVAELLGTRRVVLPEGVAPEGVRCHCISQDREEEGE
jgi:hypothetical protein